MNVEIRVRSRPCDRSVSRRLRASDVETLVALLPKREADVLRFRYGFGVSALSDDEIADRLDIPRGVVADFGDRGYRRLVAVLQALYSTR